MSNGDWARGTEQFADRADAAGGKSGAGDALAGEDGGVTSSLVIPGEEWARKRPLRGKGTQVSPQR